MVCGFTLLTLAAFSSRATAHAATSSASELARDFIHVNGQRLVAPGGGEFHIRAIGTGSTATDPSEKDYEEMARLKFNAATVFLSYKRFYDEGEPDKFNGVGWKRIEQHVALARKFGFRVILQMLLIEGAQFVPSKDEAFDYRIWVQPQLQERLIKLWEAIAQRYKDEPQILGYGIFCEPVTAGTRSNGSIWRTKLSHVSARSTTDTSSLSSGSVASSVPGARWPVSISPRSVRSSFCPIQISFTNFIFLSATNTRINTPLGEKIAISAFIILIRALKSFIARR
jgi:hypothetical protein